MANFKIKWLRQAFLAAISVTVIHACISSSSIHRSLYTTEATVSSGLYLQSIPQGLGVLLPVPENNPLTIEKSELGRMLFFDQRLSRDGTTSCASCHLPEKAFTDGLVVSVGIDEKLGRRNAPSLLNSAYLPSMFRDGRLKTLEQQALEPMTNPVELGNTHDEIVKRLRADKTYLVQFERAFGSKNITIQRTAEALASFERTLLSGDSDFDRYMVAGDLNAMSAAALRGLKLFRGEANCQLCHEHSLFSDNRFHNTGVSWGTQPLDLGRYEVTESLSDKGKFRTPGLRDIEYTAPYMHDGSMGTLEEVLEYYNEGGNSNANLDLSIQPLNLSSKEQADIVAFLKTLSGSSWKQQIEANAGRLELLSKTGN